MRTVKEFVEWWDSHGKEWKQVVWEPPGDTRMKPDIKLDLCRKNWPDLKFQIVRETITREVVKIVGPKRGKK